MGTIMPNRAKIIAVFAFVSFLFSGCTAKKDEKVAEKPPVAVEVSEANFSNIVEGVEVTGTLEAKNSVDVKTQIPGLVKQIFVNEWVKVTKGQPLLKIDLSEVEAMGKRAQAAVASAKASFAQAKVAAARSDRELERLKNLKASGLATQQALDDAMTEHDASKARIDSAKAQISASEEDLRQIRARQNKGVVVAPISGTVSEKNINIGDLTSDIAASKPVFRIVDNSLLKISVAVPSSESAKIKVGDRLSFVVDSLPEKVFEAKVMHINPEISASDRSMKVEAEIRNSAETLKAGLFAKGKIITKERKNALVIPRSAVSNFDIANKTALLPVVENGNAKIRKIRIGVISQDTLEVIEGLKSGEKYITRGGFNLKDGDKIAVAGAKK